MAERVLLTDWKRIGRSGPTVDGRTISPQFLRDAADTYNKELFTALIWPEHQRWANFGTIERLDARDNSEGGVDLFAILSPNQFYIGANQNGQKLFTSMELMPDFRKTGKAYLTGLGATDDPASASTTEIRLSCQAAKDGALIGDSINTGPLTFSTQAPTPSSNDDDLKAAAGFFARLAAFFKTNTPEDDDMADKAALEQFKQQIEALTAEIATFKTQQAAPPAAAETFNAEDAVKALTDKITALEQKFSTQDAAAGQSVADKFAGLESKLADLTEKLSAALKEVPGTTAGENTGGQGDDLKSYI